MLTEKEEKWKQDMLSIIDNLIEECGGPKVTLEEAYDHIQEEWGKEDNG